MTRRLLLSYLTITAFVLLLLEVPLGLSFANNEIDQLTADLERDARVLATVVEDYFDQNEGLEPQGVADDYSARTGGRVVIVDGAGVSVADSDRPDERRDFSTRDEIAVALSGGLASGTRHSDTLDEDIVYVAVPIASGGKVLGAVRLTYSRDELDERIRRNWLTLAAIAGVVLVTVAAVGWFLARSVTRPVRALARGADDLAHGDLSTRVSEQAGPPELRALAHEFNVMAARLEELVGAQRAFVADASHELRTPLTALRLRLENLEDLAGPELQDELHSTTAEVVRLSRLVEGLLDLARQEGGRAERVAVDVAAECRERADVWHDLAEEQGVAIVVDCPADLPALAAPDVVAQMLDNLLANALDVAPTGSQVTIRARQAGDDVEVHVIDEGPGLTPAERDRAFDRFWRGPDATPGGSGLGLAIVAQLALANGGHAELRDVEPGTGVDAVVVLDGVDAARAPR
jgi:signal transduction histidine kinase